MSDKNIGIHQTFWSLLNHGIKIPRLQRNYVQGRKDIRGHLLAEELIKNVIDAVCKPERKLVLDLVYGIYEKTFEGEYFLPLDGQQRLTLLWLIHWYIAQRAQKFDDAKLLKKFIYATRESSADFMRTLVDDFRINNEKEQISIFSQIEESRFFCIEWFFDPTIHSMMEVIRFFDNNITEKNDKFSDIWQRLISSECNIQFRVCDIDILNQTDELYVKMNGRGRSLEYIENMKADFIKRIGSKSWVNNFDNDWFSLFWNQLSLGQQDSYYKDCLDDCIGPDAAFYQFICRFFMDHLLMVWNTFRSRWAHAKEEEKEEYLENGINGEAFWEGAYRISLTPDIVKEWSNSAKFKDVSALKELKSYEISGKYSSIIPFSISISDNSFLESAMRGLEQVMESLLKYQNQNSVIDFINTFSQKYWVEGSGIWIPSANKLVSNFTDEGFVIFHAIILYLKHSEGVRMDSVFKKWMRFVWNIVENSNNDYEKQIIFLDDVGTKLLVDVYAKLKDSSEEKVFYQCLSRLEYECKKEKNRLELQLEEEIEKAKWRASPKSNFIQILDKAEERMRGFTRIFYCNKEKSENSEHEAIEQETFIKRYNRFEFFLKKCSYRESRELLKFFCSDKELTGCEIFYPGEGENKINFWKNQFRYLEGSKNSIPFDVLKRYLESQYVECVDNCDRLKRLRNDKYLVKYLIKKGRPMNNAKGYVLNGDHLWIYNNRKGNYIRIDDYGRLRSKVIKSLWEEYGDSDDKQTYDISKSEYVYGKWVRFKYDGQAYRWSPYEPIIIMDKEIYIDKNDPPDKGEPLPGDPIQIDVNNVNYEEFEGGLKDLASRNDGDKCYHLKVEFT